jgi:hypothetical protein
MLPEFSKNEYLNLKSVKQAPEYILNVAMKGECGHVKHSL